jgi:hypothetical protein
MPWPLPCPGMTLAVSILIGLTEVGGKDAVFMKHITLKVHVTIPTAVHFFPPFAPYS